MLKGRVMGVLKVELEVICRLHIGIFDTCEQLRPLLLEHQTFDVVPKLVARIWQSRFSDGVRWRQLMQGIPANAPDQTGGA